jgi:fructokinase
MGTGLVVLDVVLSEVSGEPARYWAGGTCGNVLIALSYLGWQAQPIARLKSGDAAQWLLADLELWGVSKEFISVTEDGSTPVIVQRIKSGSDGPRHSFSSRCPSCGKRFSWYKPVVIPVAEEIAQRMQPPQVFFFDQVSAGALLLARACAEAGALVVFEPSGVWKEAPFRQAWQAAHVVKYSRERLKTLPEVADIQGPHLQIETLGPDGLRYRRLVPDGKADAWVELPALPVADFKDAAGSGDWCTAGFLALVAPRGLAGFLQTSADELREALRLGQALAAWNCRFEGARGGMYADCDASEQQVPAVLRGKGDRAPAASPAQVQGGAPSLCSACTKPQS